MAFGNFPLLPTIFIALVILVQCFAAWVEMLAWTTRGPKMFRFLPEDIFEETKVLAANQGFYNLLLAVGLIWPFFIGDADWAGRIALFFLFLVWAAGVYGTLSASRPGAIFWTPLRGQAAPATIAIVTLWCNWPMAA